jgi:hypothetical protein
VVEEEVHPAGQRVPRFQVLDVHCERRVPAAAGLAAGPLRLVITGTGWVWVSAKTIRFSSLPSASRIRDSCIYEMPFVAGEKRT